MMIKNYVAKDMYEAMVTIKQELGSDAVIVSNRYVRPKGAFGFFKKKIVEVTAAVDITKKNSNGIIKKNYKEESSTNEENQITSNLEVLKHELKEEIIDEMRELKEAINLIVKKEETERTVEKIDNSTYTDTNQESPNKEPISKNIDEFKSILREMDFHSDIINDFTNYCSETEAEINKMTLYEFVKDRVTSKLPECNESALGRIRMFIGPTGVGKTTSIAKLASKECLNNKKSVGLITVDTYRIGAIEQLKIYANILDIPIKVVFSPSEIADAINSFKDKDLIFIDSTGRSQKNIGQLSELEEYIKGFDDIHKYLVLSMTTKNTDFMKIIDSYKKVGFDSLLLTKFDETYSYGNILNTSYVTTKPISYISTGQNVPDDIEVSTKDKIFKYIWGEI